MRLRNVKNAEDYVNKSKYIVRDVNNNKNKWNEVFGNKNKIFIEIGMGKGDFIINEALNNPNINYIGIEKFQSVILRATQKLDDMDIPNLKLICMDAEKIEDVFNKEIEKIYLNFSDPWPKNRHRDRRLSSPMFISKYKNIVKDKVVIEMKTDNVKLFDYSINTFNKLGFTIKKIDRDYGNNKNNVSKTEYEKKFISMNVNINYVKAEL